MKQNQILIHNKVEVVENRDDVVWAMDVNFRLTAFNQSFEQKFQNENLGIPEKGMDLRPIYEKGVFFSSCKNGCERALNRYATTSNHTLELNGAMLVHEFSFQPYMDGSGNVIGCCIWQKDVTEEVNNNKRIKESETKYREAQKVANVGHWNWDMLNDEITWSDQLYRIFGQIPGKFEATFESLMAILHPEDREAFQEDVENSISNNVLHDIVHRIIVNDGETRYVHQKGSVFYDENGKPYQMSGTTQDVTKDIAYNHKIIEQNHELQNFVRIISHNLRGPIANLLMLSKIYDWGHNEMNDDIMQKIEQTTEALDQTIKDLNLSLSLKSGDKDRFREVDLNEVMKEVDTLLAEDITKTKTTVLTDFSNAETVFGAKSYVSNILYNLVQNAIKYRKEEEKLLIQINTEVALEHIVLKVSDNGIGIELTPERQRKIFDMYGRLSGNTEGKGLGLYLVKNQIEAMNGKIEVESEIGVGTTFRVYFAK
ncbi:sensor histidine kinase [Flagellimonas zhangzhouensis]|uniref:histidine kinase n=1 Tax=Flagellimonas zhangzhouensis TaxID=1073328 RepID=A0A1H2WS87_9FLAO|nr:PAS domain-containing sensor histidine kinase [Allomuricauda zhangzhouensis]SDQ24134.1 PAS domain S-box-containing protein [Allomuricauda zhangzhouensis]SDW83326.1 PAS domain S-box-containing protein [Allomuricauda zhangzhouensis]